MALLQKVAFALGPRRGVYVDAGEELAGGAATITDADFSHFLAFDAAYRALCAILYNYVPGSGHPGDRSPRAASFRRSCSTRSTTTCRIPTRRPPISFRTRRATKRLGSTRCGPSETKWPGSPVPACFPPTSRTNSGWRTSWGSGATR